VNIGLVYPLSTLGIHSKEYTNTFSLHAFVGLSKGERGFAAAGFSNIVLEDAKKFQVAGFYNQIGGEASGFTAAGFLNRYETATGFQAAGFLNLSRGNVSGSQFAGFMNTSQDMTGFQAAGLLNLSDAVHGTQIAGLVNTASDVKGTQIAGWLNKAGKVKGIQLSGFINIADSSEYSIAPINILGNGEMWLGVTVDDNLTTMITFRSGSRKVYGIVGAGYNADNKDKNIAIQYGLGAHFFYDSKLHLNTEATVNHLVGEGKGVLFKSSLSALAAFRPTERFEIFAGPSFNYVNITSKTDRGMVDDYLWHRGTEDGIGRMYGLYVGYTAGVHFLLP